MACYHFRIKTHSRRAPAGAVALAAYRSGNRPSSMLRSAAYRAAEVLLDERTGERHDFSRKGGVERAMILAPADAPAWACDRAALWNAVEAAEKRKDARLAREAEMMIPRELSPGRREVLVRDFVRREFVSRGMVADVSIHCPTAADGHDQPHAHVLLTTRAIGPDGFGAKRRDWDDRNLVIQWRQAWAKAVNDALADTGSTERIDHRSLAAQRQEAEERARRFRAAGRDAAARRYEQRAHELERAPQKPRGISAKVEAAGKALERKARWQWARLRQSALDTVRAHQQAMSRWLGGDPLAQAAFFARQQEAADALHHAPAHEPPARVLEGRIWEPEHGR